MTLRLRSHQLAGHLALADDTPRRAGGGDELKTAGGHDGVEQRGITGHHLERAFREQSQHVWCRTRCQRERDLSERAEPSSMWVESTPEEAHRTEAGTDAHERKRAETIASDANDGLTDLVARTGPKGEIREDRKDPGHHSELGSEERAGDRDREEGKDRRRRAEGRLEQEERTGVGDEQDAERRDGALSSSETAERA